MKIYIAGKITGLDYEYAESLFVHAESALEASGHEPLNPMKLSPVEDGKQWVDYMCDCIRVVTTQAEGLYMLDNWQDSRGARIEHAIAREFNLPIFYQETPLPT